MQQKQSERLRLHKQILQMRKQIKEVEEKKVATERFKLFIESILSQLTSHAALRNKGSPVPVIITTQAFNRRLREKAKEMRIMVPALYRPNFKLADRKVKDNGGLARPPPRISGGFNQAAGVPEGNNVKCDVKFGL
jgi:hypothetical protein